MAFCMVGMEEEGNCCLIDEWDLAWIFGVDHPLHTLPDAFSYVFIYISWVSIVVSGSAFGIMYSFRFVHKCYILVFM